MIKVVKFLSVFSWTTTKTMAKINQVKIVPINTHIDETLLPYIKHPKKTTVDGEEEYIEEQLHKLSEDAGPYKILLFLSNFVHVCANLNWTTAKKLFQKFPMHLATYHREVWELAKADNVDEDTGEDVEAFMATMQQFKEELLDGYEYEDQMDYLRSLKKPLKMDPNKFLLKLRSANGMVMLLRMQGSVLKG